MSAPVIRSRTFLSATDKRIELADGQAARALPFDTWSKIRIGVRLAMADTGANLTGYPVMAFGLNSGSAQLFGDASCKHFVGLVTPHEAVPGYTGQWTRAADYQTSVALGSRIGTTYAYNTILSGIAFDYPLDTYATGWWIEIDKSGGTTWKFRSFHRTAGSVDAIPSELFYVSSEAGHGLMSLPDCVYTANPDTDANARIVVDEATNGTLDTVVISWDRETPVFEISDLSITKLA
jgi:hypothetical protein